MFLSCPPGYDSPRKTLGTLQNGAGDRPLWGGGALGGWRRWTPPLAPWDPPCGPGLGLLVPQRRRRSLPRSQACANNGWLLLELTWAFRDEAGGRGHLSTTHQRSEDRGPRVFPWEAPWCCTRRADRSRDRRSRDEEAPASAQAVTGDTQIHKASAQQALGAFASPRGDPPIPVSHEPK